MTINMRYIITLAFALLLQTIYAQRTDAVIFSQRGGFYDDSFSLSLSCSVENHIRYTTNGATPDSTSALYTEPLLLNSSLYSKSNIYTITNTIPSTFFLPNNVERIITIRAAAFDENEKRVSDTKTNSYIIKQLGYDSHQLPIISITTDSLNLFDYDTGIFVPGASYDVADSTHTGNFHLTGREWERTVNFEFYENDNSGVNQQCGLRTHGGASRWFQQKGMKLYARDEYGQKRFEHQFFTDSEKADFKHLNLHPFRCSNWLQTGGQEYIAQRLASNLDVEALSVREVVVFINGEYWGIYTLEESPDERYLEDHFNVSLDEVNIIKFWILKQYGQIDKWIDFRTWMESAHLDTPDDEEYAFSVIDVGNFIDYMLLQTYTANLDWPHNNVLQWQAANGQPFRWIFFDGDGCLTTVDHNAFNLAFNSGGNSLIFKKMWQSQNFRNMFYQRYYTLKDTHFAYNNLKTYLDDYRNLTNDEITNQSLRFGFPNNYDKWLTHMNTCEQFLSNRPSHFDNDISHSTIENEDENNPFRIMPNPASSTFTICISNTGDITLPVEIYDCLGRKVFAETLQCTETSYRTTITTNLTSGLYLVRIQNQTQRIVIQ